MHLVNNRIYTHPSDSDEHVGVRIYLRRGTAAEWAKHDPVLRLNEVVYIDDTGTLKVGDGVQRWSQLPEWEPAT